MDRDVLGLAFLEGGCRLLCLGVFGLSPCLCLSEGTMALMSTTKSKALFEQEISCQRRDPIRTRSGRWSFAVQTKLSGLVEANAFAKSVLWDMLLIVAVVHDALLACQLTVR